MNRTCSPGEYEIFVSVGLMDGTPVFELPYNDSDSHKRYKLGKVKGLYKIFFCTNITTKEK